MLKPLKKTPLHVEIEAELLKEVKKEAKKQKLKLREVVEYYFREFLKGK